MNSIPERDCDLIMKGGTTSGTVYPRAVRQLMSDYRLVNIGGTSAGAIAAAAAAAAEVGREKGSLDKLDDLASALPEKLLHFFEPRPESVPILQVGLNVVKFGLRKGFARSLPILIREYFGWLITSTISAAVLAGILVYCLWYSQAASGLVTFMIGFSICLCVLLGVAVWLISSLMHFIGVIKTEFSYEKDFGICPGAGQSPDSKDSAFTDWFAQQLNDLAGRPADNAKPLTFGDLKTCDGREIRLVVLTTSITNEMPVTIPFKNETFYFKPDELDGKIPASVLVWLKANCQKRDGTEYYRLPDRDDFPLILAVRLSLSFPLLFTVMKLHRYSEATGKFVEVIFSDGGITSNFPIHFFDSIWPSRPTFGITLDRTDETEPKLIRPVFGDQLEHTGLQSRKMIEAGDFVSALLSTMQSWQDAELSNMPASRQRIIHIPLMQTEGGLNLDMDETTIKQLLSRGEEAGKLFSQFNWENHRWTRYVSSVISFSKSASEMEARWDTSQPNGPDMDQSHFIEYYCGQSSTPESWCAQAASFSQELIKSAQYSQDLGLPGFDIETRIVTEKP